MSNIEAPVTSTQKIPSPTPVKARFEPPEVGVKLPEPSPVVAAAVEVLLLGGEVVVGHGMRVVLVTG
jgi:hypothetical protein